MKLSRSTIIMATIFIVLLAIYVFLPLESSEAPFRDYNGISDDERVLLISFGKDNFVKIERDIRGDKITIEKIEDEFKLVYPLDYNWNSLNVDEMVNQLSFLTSSKVVSLEPLNYTDYGLDNPQAVISLTNDTEETIVIYIGNRTYSAENYYIKKHNEQPVYCISSYVAEALLKNIFNNENEEVY